MSRALTVLQMLPALEGGGVERGTLEVAAELVRQGHRSIVISSGGGLVEQLVAEGSEHISWDVRSKRPWTLRYVRRLRRWLRDNRVDILHPRSRVPAWVAYLAWRKMPAETRPHFVTTVHGLNSVNAYSRIMTRGERVIVVSNTVRDYILQNYPQTDPQRLRLIPRGVDPAEFPHAWKPTEAWRRSWFAQFPQLRDRRVLTLPGRITRLKGHHDFIELIARLRQQGANVHGLVVGGEDPYRKAYAQEIRGLVREKRLQADITFTGARFDIRDVFAVSDLVLSLSTQPESFGRTVLEALSLGVPVAGYDQGGVGEILAALYPAGRVPSGDLAALQGTVEALLRGAPAVPAEQPFTLSAMLASTLGVYRELTEGSALPAGAGQ